MFRWISLLSFSFCLLFTSCHKVNLSLGDNNVSDMVSDAIPIDEAVSELERFLVEIERETKSVSLFDSREITAFGAVSFARTKSETFTIDLPDSLLYLVNFSDSAGFAILSANRLVGNKVLAYVESGNIDINTFIDAYDYMNNGIGFVESYSFVDEDIIVPEMLLTSLLNLVNHNVVSSDFNQDITEDDLSFNERTVGVTRAKSISTNSIKYGPFVKTKWCQSSPLNDLCGGYSAGCCAIATGQIILSNKYSSTMLFDGKECSWSDLESVFNYQTHSYKGSAEAQNQAAHFINMIRSKDYCNIKKTSGDSIGAKRAFEKFGYKNVTRHWGIGTNTRDKIHQCLQNRHPVYVDGLNKKLFSAGHCWLIDGYIDYITSTLYQERLRNTILTSHRYYHHINWGWNGKYDGYYHVDDFNVANRQSFDDVIDSDTHSLRDSSVEGDHFSWDIWVVTYSI